jgi:hypothetical protein
VSATGRPPLARLAALALVLSACWTADDIVPGGGDDGDDTADAAPEPDVPPEIDGRLVINEVMADNALTVQDDTGIAADWIELYNPNDRDVSLYGYGVTDDLDEPHKAVLPDGLAVPAGGYLVLWLDGNPDKGPEHVGLRVAREAGEVALSRPDRSPIDRLRYAEQAVDFSAARTPDGSDQWTITWHPTPGEANQDGGGAPVGLEEEDAAAEEIPAAGDLSEQILGDDVMPEIGLVIPPASAAALASQPFVYVEATLVYDGREYGPVGLRLKGGNSFLPLSQKAAFRINIDEFVDGAKFFGMDDLTLNNMSTDYSMMHDRAAYWIARRLGLPASRANHALVTVNGEFYGLFSNVETVKSRMMARWFDEPNGPLYEATDVDFTPAYVAAFEHEGGPDDRTLIQETADALSSGQPATAIGAVAAYVDMTRFRRFWAMSAVIGQFDAFPYSNPGDDFFVYADPTSARLHFMPWGMDETFYAGDFDVKEVHSVLATTCMQVTGCYDAWVDEVWRVMDEVDQMDLLGRLDFIQAQIAPHVARDVRKPYTNTRVETYQENIRWFVNDRRTNLQQMLGPPD